MNASLTISIKTLYMLMKAEMHDMIGSAAFQGMKIFMKTGNHRSPHICENFMYEV